MNILIVKFGALGDVVRTSYFAEKIKDKYLNKCILYWITAKNAVSILDGNPYIDVLLTDFSSIERVEFDHIYSLDDEIEIVEAVSKLKSKKITGAICDQMGNVSYTDDASGWFDMGLISKFGKLEADRLKKQNKRSHGEIFSEIFSVEIPQPKFYYPQSYIKKNFKKSPESQIRIGINPYAGARWPSKELQLKELKKLINLILGNKKKASDFRIILLGSGLDRVKNLELADFFNGSCSIDVPNSDSSILDFAALIESLDFLITSDSLALHLAIAQKVSFIAFFSSTSAVEIDDFKLGVKLISTGLDYCSYKPDADNSSITAERIFNNLPFIKQK